MPRHSKPVSVATVVVKTPKQRARPRPAAVITKVSRQGPRSSRIASHASSGLASAYMKCLTDPFTNPPVRAGFGTLVPTSIETAYLRGSITTASDGSFNMFVLPNPNNLLLVTTAGISVTPTGLTSSLTASANATVLNGLANSGRTLAMGLRLIPMIPSTSVPGVISLGCAPRCDLPDLVAQSATQASTSPVGLFNLNTSIVSQMPYLREHMARPGGLDFFQCTWRPTDVKDFEFVEKDGQVIYIQNAGSLCPFYDSLAINDVSDSQGSYIIATGQALPANTVVYYEIILHIETTTSTHTIADSSTSAISPTIASTSSFPSFESMYRSIVARLPEVDTVIGAARSMLSSSSGRRALTHYAQRAIVGIRSSGYELVSR